jgi:uncharacterized protein
VTPSGRPYALVTGASAGLGRAYAESLAARGHDLLLVARREDRLRALARELGERHGVTARVAVCDLTRKGGLTRCRAAIDALPGSLEVAVLNAGFGSRGPFTELERSFEADMARLNCVAVVDLAAHVLPTMRAHGHGALVVMSSAAAFQPMPFMATYAATKAFELAFAEALHEELRGTGVRVVSVCPGPTSTEFSEVAGGEAPLRWSMPLDDPADVVAATWRALAGGRRRVTTGRVARAAEAASRVLPRGAVLRLAGRARSREVRGALKGSREHS